MHSELRQLIRVLLEQEIHALGVQSKVVPAPAQDLSTEVPPRHSIQEEFINITSDADLANFVTRMLQLSADPVNCSALRTGQLVFRLATSNGYAATHCVPANLASQSNKTVQSYKTIQNNKSIQSNNVVQTSRVQQNQSSVNDVVRFERGLFTERDSTNLDPAVRVLQIGRTVRITPLAADSLRHRGISTQRAES